MFQQLINLLQRYGIPAMGFLFIVGLLILLTSGKSPIRKRAGYIFAITFGIGILVVAYSPIIFYQFEHPINHFDEGISTSNSGVTAFPTDNVMTTDDLVAEAPTKSSKIMTAIWYIAIPVTFLMFNMGIFIQLLAAKIPARKRLGMGLMIFSPIILGITYILPTLLGKL